MESKIIKFKYIYDAPQNELFRFAKEVETPSIIYDFNQIRNTANAIKNDLCIIKEAKLNFAIKACHNMDILKTYVEIGLGCDVASIFEYNLARTAGFKDITTTAPAYKIDDMRILHNEGIIIDLDSIDQIELFGQAFPGEQIGLRVKIPNVYHYNNKELFSDYERFGVNIFNQDLSNIISKYNLKIKRLHVHTGEMIPEIFEYKIRYLLTIAEYFDDIDTIDIGGGLFGFYVNRKKAILSLETVSSEVKKWEMKNKRNIKIIFEPGGALITTCGYLITQVISVDYNEKLQKRIVTVDSSAWNLAPWHVSDVRILNCDNQIKKTNQLKATLIAGNTLYQNDFFGNTNSGEHKEFYLDNLKYGDRLILSASGGYTMTNARKFNGLPLPKEYKLFNGLLERI